MGGAGGGEGGFLVEHAVVSAAVGGDATRAQVDDEGEDGRDTIRRGEKLARCLRLKEWVGNIQAGDGERGKRFIHSANHDTTFVAPCLLCAAISEEGTDIPCQESKANGPKGSVAGID